VARSVDHRVSVLSIDGTKAAGDSPFYNDAGKLVMMRIRGKTLSRVAEAPIGRWSQGAAFSPDGKIAMKGGPVAIRIAER
jgi:hypothetical protein